MRRKGEEYFGEGQEDFEFDEYLKYTLYEPMVEVRDAGSCVKVLIEVSGSSQESVVVDFLTPKSIDVSVKYRGRLVKKRLDLPQPVKTSRYEVKVKNGVAQIIFQKA